MKRTIKIEDENGKVLNMTVATKATKEQLDLDYYYKGVMLAVAKTAHIDSVRVESVDGSFALKDATLKGLLLHEVTDTIMAEGGKAACMLKDWVLTTAEKSSFVLGYIATRKVVL